MSHNHLLATYPKCALGPSLRARKVFSGLSLLNTVFLETDGVDVDEAGFLDLVSGRTAGDPRITGI